MHHLGGAKDLRGELSVGEFGRDVPFTPKRYFLVFNVPSREVSGEHAHKHLRPVSGLRPRLMRNSARRWASAAEISLDSPSRGVYIPAMIWGTQYRYSQDAVLLVFASHAYDPADYIRSYDEFRAAVRPRDP